MELLVQYMRESRTATVRGLSRDEYLTWADGWLLRLERAAAEDGADAPDAGAES